ncbi:MAG: hypothetical protein JXR73_18660 [Candidatus Omnitrophica bacterium]|nr:hypothetical protein [Candidatus Omnitrophota bacterium]
MNFTIVATGLACLDVMDVDSDEPPRLSAGGFPNAMILLRRRGWSVAPVVDLGEDRAGDYVLEEFRRWRINDQFVRRRSDIQTPIYVLYHRNGGHDFVKQCPYCEERFPLYKPVSPDFIDAIEASLPKKIDVFYFDKVSPAALKLAKICRRRSAWIVFEPNRIDDADLFRQSVEICDLIKYSRDRRVGVQEITGAASVPLEIETAGSEGLRYRVTCANQKSEWRALPPAPLLDFVDAAGAGDWLTASLISSIATPSAFQAILKKEDELQRILIKGQEASAYNCRFAGARGALYVDRPMLRGRDFCPCCQGR